MITHTNISNQAHFNLQIDSIIVNSFTKLLEIQTFAAVIIHDTKCPAKTQRVAQINEALKVLKTN